MVMSTRTSLVVLYLFSVSVGDLISFSNSDLTVFYSSVAYFSYDIKGEL